MTPPTERPPLTILQQVVALETYLQNLLVLFPNHVALLDSGLLLKSILVATESYPPIHEAADSVLGYVHALCATMDVPNSPNEVKQRYHADALNALYELKRLVTQHKLG